MFRKEHAFLLYFLPKVRYDRKVKLNKDRTKNMGKNLDTLDDVKKMLSKKSREKIILKKRNQHNQNQHNNRYQKKGLLMKIPSLFLNLMQFSLSLISFL